MPLSHEQEVLCDHLEKDMPSGSAWLSRSLRSSTTLALLDCIGADGEGNQGPVYSTCVNLSERVSNMQSPRIFRHFVAVLLRPDRIARRNPMQRAYALVRREFPAAQALRGTGVLWQGLFGEPFGGILTVDGCRDMAGADEGTHAG